MASQIKLDPAAQGIINDYFKRDEEREELTRYAKFHEDSISATGFWVLGTVSTGYLTANAWRAYKMNYNNIQSTVPRQSAIATIAGGGFLMFWSWTRYQNSKVVKSKEMYGIDDKMRTRYPVLMYLKIHRLEFQNRRDMISRGMVLEPNLSFLKEIETYQPDFKFQENQQTSSADHQASTPSSNFNVLGIDRENFIIKDKWSEDSDDGRKYAQESQPLAGSPKGIYDDQRQSSDSAPSVAMSAKPILAQGSKTATGAAQPQNNKTFEEIWAEKKDSETSSGEMKRSALPAKNLSFEEVWARDKQKAEDKVSFGKTFDEVWSQEKQA